nr:hypothetical protein [Candidatus Levybacteria bacterium]
MKTTSLILVLLIFLASVMPSFAQALLPTSRTGSLDASRSALKVQTEATRLENLKQRANTEITRRINFLTELLAKLDEIKQLSDTDKTSLKSQIQTQIDSLNALKIKIDADSDLITLREDVKSILNGYYIFAYFRVKVSLYVAAARLTTTSDILNTVYTKLQTRVGEEETKGTDVTALKALLSDMLAKITDAKTQHDAAITALNTLDAQSFSKNKSPFLDIRSKLKLGAEDLRAAYKDAIQIRQALGDVKGNLKKGTFETKDSTHSGATE